jgi:hypothetical protein
MNSILACNTYICRGHSKNSLGSNTCVHRIHLLQCFLSGRGRLIKGREISVIKPAFNDECNI